MYLFIYELGAQVTEKELFVNGSVPQEAGIFTYLLMSQYPQVMEFCFYLLMN